eukprot:gene22465-biopygen13274
MDHPVAVHGRICGCAHWVGRGARRVGAAVVMGGAVRRGGGVGNFGIPRGRIPARKVRASRGASSTPRAARGPGARAGRVGAEVGPAFQRLYRPTFCRRGSASGWRKRCPGTWIKTKLANPVFGRVITYKSRHSADLFPVQQTWEFRLGGGAVFFAARVRRVEQARC